MPNVGAFHLLEWTRGNFYYVSEQKETSLQDSF